MITNDDLTSAEEDWEVSILIEDQEAYADDKNVAPDEGDNATDDDDDEAEPVMSGCVFSLIKDADIPLKFPADSFAGQLIGHVAGSDTDNLKRKTISACSWNTPKNPQAANDEEYKVTTYNKPLDPNNTNTFIRLCFKEEYYFASSKDYVDYLSWLAGKPSNPMVNPAVPTFYDPGGKQATINPVVGIALRSHRKADTTKKMNEKSYAFQQYWNAVVAGLPGLGAGFGRCWDLPADATDQQKTSGENITLYIATNSRASAYELCRIAEKLKVIKRRRFNPHFKPLPINGNHQYRLWSSELFGFYSIWISDADREVLLGLQGLRAAGEQRALEYKPFPLSTPLDEVKLDLTTAYADMVKVKEAANIKPPPIVVADNIRATELQTITMISENSMKSVGKRSTTQSSLMGGLSARELGKKLWPGTDHEPKCEWLHRSAHSFGKMTWGTSPLGSPQVSRNLVIGTFSANSLMLRYEDSIRRLAMHDEATLYTFIPLRPKTEDNLDADLTVLGIPPERMQDFRTAMADNDTWFSPFLEYTVSCSSKTIATTELVPTFILRKVLAWEKNLDRIVEHSVFYDKSLEESAGIKVKPISTLPVATLTREQMKKMGAIFKQIKLSEDGDASVQDDE